MLAASALLSACDKPAAPNRVPGYAEGEYVYIAAPFAGTLTSLSVQRGATIKAGAPLFSLEHENEAAAQREAAQHLAAAQATLTNLQKPKRPPEIEAVQNQIRQAQATVAMDRKTVVRQQALIREHFASQATLDEAQSALDRDQARVAELKNQLQVALTGARPYEIAGAEAQVRASQAALAQANWKLGQKSARAPAAAFVDDTLYVPGDWVPAGSPVVSLLPPQNIRVRFFVPENQLGALKIGQPVSITCNGCSGQIPASIRYIASQNEFTPPVLYNRDNRDKLVYRVEAALSPQEAVKLHPGQPVDVRFGQ